MPELDPFDARLRAGVRTFADRALTSVDAAATAERAMRPRRIRRLAWLGAAVPVPVSMLILIALLVLALAATLGIGASRNGQVVLPPAPSAAPAAAPSASHRPTPTPGPATDGKDEEVVTGTQLLELTTPYTQTSVGDVTQRRGGVITTTNTASDPRVSGTGMWRVSADLRGTVGPQWGPYRLENAAGAWDGTCGGSTGSGDDGAAWSCWLTGSGAYDGYSYFMSVTSSGPGSADVRGVITPGPPPEP